MKACKHCGSDTSKVIYAGFPMRLCVNGFCNGVDGFWSFVVSAMPIATDDGEFAFMAYDGSYLRALFAWLRPA